MKPVPGDWSLMKEHIRAVICAGNYDLFFWLLGWMANLVQHPGQPGEVAIVMRGPQGTGKGVFARALGSLVGHHFVPVSHPRHLKGNFNAHLEDALIVFADEAFEPTDKEGLGVLKTFVTEPEIAIEKKGRDVFVAPNRVHLLIASNEDLVVAAGLDERRFLVLDVSDAHAQDHVYFEALEDQMNNGGREAMLHDLLAFSFIGEVNLRQAPATSALQEQKRLSMRPHEDWWFRKLEDGQLLSRHEGWEDEVERQELEQDFTTQLGVKGQGAATQLGMLLRKVLPDGYPRKFQRMVGGMAVVPQKRWHWGFPKLGVCRAHFDKLMRTENEWPQVTAQDDADED